MAAGPGVLGRSGEKHSAVRGSPARTVCMCIDINTAALSNREHKNWAAARPPSSYSRVRVDFINFFTSCFSPRGNQALVSCALGMIRKMVISWKPKPGDSCCS